MTAAWAAVRSGSTRTTLAIDGAFAVVLGGLAGEGSWSAAADRGVRLGPAGYVLVGVAAAALVVRRRWPLRALLVSLSATLVFLVALEYPYGPILELVSVAAYSVGAWCEGRTSTSAVAAAIVLYVPLAWWRGAAPWSGVRVLPLAVLWLAVPWGAGLAVRAYRRMRARAVAAERRGYAYQERLRIAREVHDLVGHSLAVINLQAGVALHVAARRPQRAVEALQAVRQTSGRALEDLRATLGLLTAGEPPPAVPGAPAAGEPPSTASVAVPGGASLAGIAELVTAVGGDGLRVELAVDGQAAAVPEPVALAGYRIVQESLTNVVRHAGARRATVRLAYRPGEVALTVTDDGRGGPVPDGLGRGVRGMRERAAALGGSLHAGPLPDGGFEVRAVLPTGCQARSWQV